MLHPVGFFTIEAGPEKDEGGLNNPGQQRVSWDHIENVTVVGGGPALILGTNGDDDITLIARDAHASDSGLHPACRISPSRINDNTEIIIDIVLADALVATTTLSLANPLQTTP